MYGGFLFLSNSVISPRDEKPIWALGSEIIMSDKDAKLLKICPVVGLLRIVIKGIFASFSERTAKDVFAICNNEKIPSCNLVPLELTVQIQGIFFFFCQF